MSSQGGEHVAGNHSNPPEVNYMGQTQQSSNPYLTSTPPQQWGPPTHNGYPPNYYYDPNVQPGSNPNTSQYQTVQSSSTYPPYQPSTTYTPYQSSNTVQYNYNSSEYSSYYNNSAPNQNNTGAPYQIPQSQSSNTCSASSMTLNNSNPPQSNTAPPPPPPPPPAGPPPVPTGSYYYHNQNPNQGFAYPGTPHPGSTVPNSSYQYQHQHQYNNQWPYPPPPPANPPPPGAAPIGALSGSYPPIQPPPPPGTASSFPSVQESGAPYQNKYPGQYQMYPPKPVDPAPLPTNNNNNQGNILYSQNPISSTNQTPPLNPIPYPVNIMPQARPVLEGSKLTLPPPPPLLPPPAQYSAVQVSKMQIATNPRIAPGLGSTGTVKNSVTNNNSNISIGTGTPKPAYVSVSILKNQNDSESKGTRDPDSILKGALPVSLRAYVERSFSRCRNDTQRSSNEILMKQIITNASSDGTLFTKNWDVEPLFPLPTGDSTNTKNTQEDSTSIFSSLTKSKRKSRWEPVEDQAPLKPPSINYNNNNPTIITPNNNYNNNYTNTNNSYSAKDNISSSRPDPSPRPYVKKAWNPVKFVSAQRPSNQQLQSKKRKYVFSRKPESQNPDSSSESDDQKDLTKYYASANSLANTPEEKKRRESRSKRFDKRKIENFAQNTDASIFARKANAMLIAKSFNNDNINNNNSNNNSLAVEDIDWDSLTVKGTCQEIEKKYLRLTSAPDPSTVRREDVLEKALEMVLKSNKNYLYKCDQLKSIRQDLTVQRIQNELTVKVYETHARLALQSGDMAEYNQCQSQLKRLYKDGINGCKNEFSAYHLLHVCLHSHNKRDLLSSMSRLSIESKEDEAIEHALKVRSAVCSGNYVLYFRLYKSAPNLNTFLMDLYAEKMRFEAVKCMAKAYRPNILVRYVSQVLGFVNDSEECEQWLRAHGAVVMLDNNGDLQFDTKASMASLYMPEPENAVSHGDASLAVDDFLTRAI